jgi:hypothetical protein
LLQGLPRRTIALIEREPEVPQGALGHPVHQPQAAGGWLVVILLRDHEAKRKSVARTLVSLCHFYLTRHTALGIGVPAEGFFSTIEAKKRCPSSKSAHWPSRHSVPR